MKNTVRQLGDKNRDWLISALKSAGDAILTANRDGLIDFVNNEAVNILGKSYDVLNKRLIFDEIQIFNELDKPVILFPEKNFEKNFSLPRGAYFLDKNGGKHYVSARSSFLQSDEGEFYGYIIVFREITQIVVKKKEVDRERLKLLKIFDILPNGMISIDKKCEIIDVNQSFLKIFNLSKKPEKGSKFGDVIACVNSEAEGCGASANCTNCNARKAFTEIINEKEIIENQRVEMDIRRNGLISTIILSLNLTRLEFKYDIDYIVTIEDITKRIKYQEDLKSARAESLRLLDSLPVMVYRLDRQFQCDFINLTFKSVFPIDEGSFISSLKERMNKEDYHKFRNKLFNSIINEAPFKINLKLSHKGDERYFIGVGHPYYDERNCYCGIVGLFLDVNDTRVAERNLLNSRRKYQLLFDSLVSSFCYFKGIYDEHNILLDAEIRELNFASEEIFDVKKNQMIGKRLTEMSFLSESDKCKALHFFNNTLTTGQERNLIEYYLEGLNRWIEYSIYSPEPGYIALLVTDIDSKKRTELKLKHAMERSETANRAKSEFLANMSHEIRTPLNGIMGMIDLTMMESLSEEQRDNLLTAKECIYSLIGIINDVLDFSKVEAGRLMIENQDFDLIELLETTVKTHKIHATEKNLELKIHYRSLPQPALHGDPNRIKQILNNLISNAIKFTEKGGVTIVVNEEYARESVIILNVTVEDTGIGIEPENFELLFKSFTQIDGSYTRQYGGTGLGLVITQKLLDMMDGSIRFDSVPSQGSRFHIKIPLQSTQIGHKIKFKQNPQMSLENYLVLLVEDDRVNQIVIEKMLSSFGIQVDTARNGREGIEKAYHRKYDLILMDVQMPIMDGIEATKIIRNKNKDQESSKNTSTPIIALTAFALEGDQLIFKKSGMNDYASKPVERNQLFHLLSQYLDNDDENLNEGGHSYSELTTKEISLTKSDCEEVNACLTQIENLFEQENYIVLEIIAHQLKAMFEKMDAQELKSLTFKMELVIRKKRLVEVVELFKRICESWKLLSSDEYKEVNMHEEYINRRG
ncbi:ATP-binding protein [Eubacteriaceae bacterium ES3]|nr:ATP-binding protein [Eubacteriaceae bacterium ES3]